MEKGKKYRVLKEFHGWDEGQIVEVVEVDIPKNYLDLEAAGHKTCIPRSDLVNYIFDGTLESVKSESNCWSCTWKLQKGFRFDYEVCMKCGKKKEVENR